MAPLDDLREKAEAAIEQAKPFIEGAMNAGAQAAEKADEWASTERPGVEGAFDAAGGAASGAVDAIADGANAVYEFIKDRAEEITGKDVDGDGQIGKIRPEDVVAGAELAAEAVQGTVDKAVAGLANATPEDVAAGAELAAEAVKDALGKAAGDVAAGVELAAEAAEDAINKASEA